MLKKIVVVSVVFIAFFSFVSYGQEKSEQLFADQTTIKLDYGKPEMYTVGVFFWHESENDLKTAEGIIDGFKLAELSSEFYIRQAFGEENTAQEIASEFKEKNFDLIYAMGTGATRRLMKDITDVPIVFTAVTNPVKSNITPDWESSGRNIAGNSNWIATEDILKTFKEAVPHLSTLGVIYDPQNSVSAMEVSVAKEVINTSKEGHIQRIEEVHVEKVSDLQPACESLVGKIEALWIPIDILVYKNLQEIKPITIPRKIPLLASSHRGVADGAMIGLVVDYVRLGKLSVPIAHKILTEGIKPKEIPVGVLDDYNIIINLKAAKEIEYEIPISLLTEADIFIK